LLNNLILLIPVALVGLIWALAILPPRLSPLTREEMTESAHYYSRLERKNAYVGVCSGRRLWDGSGEEV
jgi:hypothetical protein